MKILLIAPSSGAWRGLGKKRLFNGKTFRFSMMSLLSVAALTPDRHQIRVVDEQVEDIPWDEGFDLAGITVMTAAAPRAYALCGEFRARHIPVVLGGFHPTFNADEALAHADAVVIGPAGGAWPSVIEDVEAGRLRRIYHGDPDVEVPVSLPRHLLRRGRYVSVNTCSATLGCRNECAFCSITAFYQGRRYQRDIPSIVAHLRSFDDRFFLFMDDNLTQDRDYALRLFEAIAPLRKTWAAQVSVEAADDPELLEWMRRSGCVGVFIGLESFSKSALCSQNKAIRSPEFYRDAISRLHALGIVVEAAVIFGFDADAREVFRSTLATLDDIGADVMQASILTPLPGTRLFERMRHRIVDWNWEHYDYKWAVFEPAQMTRDELMAGLQWINKRFYSPARILRRLCRWLTMPSGLRNFHVPLLLNVAYWGRQFRFHVKGYDPSRRLRALDPTRLDEAPRQGAWRRRGARIPAATSPADLS
ncbi:MAG: radical SAM protein [Acidobacteriota bacterium]